MVIAIDGTSGSGKGTIASHVADRLGFFYLDTGIYYRSCAYLINLNNIQIDNIEEIKEIALNMQINFVEDNINLNGEDVTYKLRSNEVNNIVSYVSSIKEVRLIINDLIRNFSLNKNIIVDGRDIGSVVFPNAIVKIYLDASLEERASRRYKQNIEMNIDSSYNDILENLRLRDNIDKNKEFGALVLAEDAVYVDSTNLSIEDAINKVLDIVRSKIK